MGDDYTQLLEVQPQENYDSFALSPVHTVSGAFFTLLKNRGLVDGDVNPNHPVIAKLVELKNESYAELLESNGQPVAGAESFVSDFAVTFGIEDKNAIASTANARDIKVFLKKYDLIHLFPDERIIDVARYLILSHTPKLLTRHFVHLVCTIVNGHTSSRLKMIREVCYQHERLDFMSARLRHDIPARSWDVLRLGRISSRIALRSSGNTSSLQAKILLYGVSVRSVVVAKIANSGPRPTAGIKPKVTGLLTRF